jgi:hypothetical protein
MKMFASLALSLSLFAAPAAFADGSQPATKEVQIGVNNVYVPGGFDSSSDVFVVVNGIFPNGCYKWGRAAKKDVDTFNHEISSIADVSQGMCIMVLIPFQKEVRLGKFASGKHNLRFVNGDGTYLEKTMVIE